MVMESELFSVCEGITSVCACASVSGTGNRCNGVGGQLDQAVLDLRFFFTFCYRMYNVIRGPTVA